MDIQRKDKRRRMKGAFTGALFAILFMAMFLGIILWAAVVDSGDAIPLPILAILLAIPLLGIIGTLTALRERIKEIEGGELDEASKY